MESLPSVHVPSSWDDRSCNKETQTEFMCGYDSDCSFLTPEALVSGPAGVSGGRPSEAVLSKGPVIAAHFHHFHANLSVLQLAA